MAQTFLPCTATSQSKEKINAETWRGRGLDPQKVPEEAPVKAPHVQPHARRVREEGEQRSGISQLHFAAKPSSGFSGEEGGWRSWQYFALGWFPSPPCQQSLLLGWLMLLGMGQDGMGRDSRMGFICSPWAKRRAPMGLVGAELRQQSKRCWSPTCSAKHRETPALLVVSWAGFEIWLHLNFKLSSLENL